MVVWFNDSDWLVQCARTPVALNQAVGATIHQNESPQRTTSLSWHLGFVRQTPCYNASHETGEPKKVEEPPRWQRFKSDIRWDWWGNSNWNDHHPRFYVRTTFIYFASALSATDWNLLPLGGFSRSLKDDGDGSRPPCDCDWDWWILRWNLKALNDECNFFSPFPAHFPCICVRLSLIVVRSACS